MKPTLTSAQKKEVCKAVAQGATWDIAAAVAGCTSETINTTIDQDLDFDLRLQQVENKVLERNFKIFKRLAKQPGNRRAAAEFKKFRKQIADKFNTPIGDVVLRLARLEEHVNATITDKQVQRMVVGGLRKIVRQLPPPNAPQPSESRTDKKSPKPPRNME